MTGFEFGITAAPAEPVADWDDMFRPPPAGDRPADDRPVDDLEQAEPAPCGKDCCVPAPEGGAVL